jgi:hypothetical protein
MPEPHLRAADADRAAVADVLGTHLSAGRLTVAEYDDRLARAYAARTYGELAELTADLPATAPAPEAAPASAPGGPFCGHGWTTGRHGGWTGWLTTAVIVVSIWALTSLAAGEVRYPWPVWVLGPWGVVLLAQSLGGGPGPQRSRQRDRQRS